MNRDEVIRKKLDEESTKEDICLWMSFCDTSKPKGGQFTGVIITYAPGLATAMEKTHMLGINPGGEIKVYEIDPDSIKPEHFDKLLSKDDLIAYGYIDA